MGATVRVRAGRAGRGLERPKRMPPQWLAGAALLLLITLAAYLPAMSAGFVWDDDAYVTENAALRSMQGLFDIWFKFGATVQYYPLVFTSFWIQYHLWGLAAPGYHIVNILLHAAAAILFWRVLMQLEIPGAWLGAALFAVHPVHVESVAWVTERKNVLSLVFYLLALRSFVFALGLSRTPLKDPSEPPLIPWGDYAKGLAFFACALLSKTATVGLPIVLLILVWWKRGRFGTKSMLTIPLFVGSLIAGAVTAWVEKYHAGAGDVDWTLSTLQRLILAGQAVWFYMGKLLWPTNLAFIYDRWPVNVSWANLIYPIGVAALVALAAMAVRWLGRGPLAALLIYLVGLAPALGFVSFYFMTYSWVADHFQYVASLGPIALAAALLAKAAGRLQNRQLALGVLSTPLIFLLAGLTFARAKVFDNLETLWNDVIAKSPSARPQAHQNLAVYFNRLGRTDQVIAHYVESLKLQHNEAEPRCNLAIALYSVGRKDEAIVELRHALTVRPNYPEAASNLGVFLQEKGNLAEAEKYYRQAIEQDPDFAPAHLNFARLLAGIRRYQEAIRECQEVLRINPQDKEARDNLELLLRRVTK